MAYEIYPPVYSIPFHSITIWQQTSQQTAMTSEQVVMLSIACATCNRRVPIYLRYCAEMFLKITLSLLSTLGTSIFCTVNSHTLNLDTIEAVIAQMRENFLKLHQKFKMSETLKLHVIFSHYLEYFHDRAHTLEIHRRGYRSCSQPAQNVRGAPPVQKKQQGEHWTRQSSA